MNGMKTLAALATVALAALSPVTASASEIVDAAGDYLATYTGPTAPDLDVLGLKVFMSGGNFHVTATQAGPTGASGTAGGFFVFGVNRGAGTAGFAGLGLDKVLFDSVIIARNDGTGTLIVFGNAPVALTPDQFSFSGNTVRLNIAAALLPSSGFGEGRYGWNLWPRAPGAGDAFLADFAPDNATITAVPEPASWALMIAGMGMGGGALRCRNRRTTSTLA